MINSNSSISVIILAAGKGTRMKSNLPKVMHKVANREMLNLVIDEAKTLNPENITIVYSEELEQFKEKIKAAHFQNELLFSFQKERKGTAHAVQTAIDFLKDSGKKIGEKVLVLYGDTPLISRETLVKISQKLDQFSLCVLGFDCKSENAYGRLVASDENHLERIVEYKDASSVERQISLCNSGVMAISGNHISEFLAEVKNENAAGEFYLTDIVAIAGNKGLKRGFLKTNEEEVLGVNSRIELAQVEAIKQNLIRQKMMQNGVTLQDPRTTYFSFDTKIANDVVIGSNVVFAPNVEIDSDVEIRSFSHIEGAKIASGTVVGPFARIRPGSEIGKNVKIGNFVEVKNSLLKEGSKVNHLSYVGDAEVGVDSNIGAGVITCNYDGYNKSKTTIGDEVFVGSNSSLIAPVNIGKGAIVGAGSVITENVSGDDLAISRSQQNNIAKGAQKFRQKRKND